MTRNRWILSAVLSAAVLLAVNKASAFNPQPDPPAFGIFGILPGETARLSAWCTATLVSPMSAQSCSVEFEFEDMAGHTVKTETRTIAAGQGAFLDLVLPPATERISRSQIIPCIRVHGRGLAVSASLEVFDTVSGKTSLHMDGLSPALRLLPGIM